jgi:hypothetical protein
MIFESVRYGVFSFALLIAQICTADAGDCAFLNRDPLSLRDRQLFFQVKGDSAWTSLDDAAVDLGNQNVSYAYVIRESLDPTRNGVVVLKSGRTRNLDEPQQSRQSKNVVLVRRADAADNKRCGPVSDFGEQLVSAKSYDDYHDEGLKGSQIKTMRAFHIKYAARADRCRRTDDNGPDSLLPPDLRSNRGQFSFDPEVVAHGTYSQVLAWTGVSRASASSENLADQRVEIKQYEVSVNAPTCVRFTLPVQGRSSFLKINDLEALTQGGLNYMRSDERNWSLSR